MIQKVEVLKIVKAYYSRTQRGYYTETEVLGFFSSEEEVHRAIKDMGFDPQDFEYLGTYGWIPDDSYGLIVEDTGSESLAIYWETYDLDDFIPSNIWEDYCEENEED